MRLPATLGDLRRLVSFAIGLQRFLRRPVSRAAGLAEVRGRLDRRADLFLELFDRQVARRATSPYRALLDAAGLAPHDVEALVVRDGLEPGLRELMERGVYLAFDEFKARRPVERRGRRFRFAESDFDMHGRAAPLEVRSGGTSGPATRVLVEFDYLTARAATTALMLEAHDLWNATHGFWLPPGSGAFINSLVLVKLGAHFTRWFSQLPLASIRLPSRALTRLLRLEARVLGRRWPEPETVPLHEAWRVADWMQRALARGERPCLSTFVGSAVRVCEAARARGWDLTGATVIAMSEPLTPARRGVIEAAGARVVVHYGLSESGVVAYGCPHAVDADDAHVLDDLVALLPRVRRFDGNVAVPAYCLTSLLPVAPKVLINVETGDYGVLEPRRCGCAFEALGLTRHVAEIRSFEKLSSEGMTFVGSSLVRVLEETLPTAFGGRPIDYQVVEDESHDGLPLLRLLVDPSVGEVDETAVRERFLEGLAAVNGWWRGMAELWSQAGCVRVVRETPQATALGKALPFQARRALRAAGSSG